MRERTCLEKPGNRFKRRTRTCADNNFFSPEDACAAIRKGDLNRFGSDEASGPDKQLRPARLEASEMHIHHSIHHLAFPIAHTRHVDLSIFLGDSEFSASPKVGRDLCAMDDIFARHTGDVGTGAPLYIFVQSRPPAFPSWLRSRLGTCLLRRSRARRDHILPGVTWGFAFVELVNLICKASTADRKWNERLTGRVG